MPRNITAPDTLHAIFLTVLTALIVVPVNMVFGVATAWAVARYEFPGRKLMISLIEIPFSVSPIVAGTIYLFLYGQQGLLGPTLQSLGRPGHVLDPGDRPRQPVRHRALRRPRADPADAGAGLRGRGGRALARRLALGRPSAS